MPVRKVPAGQTEGNSRGGQFAASDSLRDEPGQLDYDLEDSDFPDDYDECPLCGEPTQYCQGHGDWNSHESYKASELRPGDRIWYEGGPEVVMTVSDNIIGLDSGKFAPIDSYPTLPQVECEAWGAYKGMVLAGGSVVTDDYVVDSDDHTITVVFTEHGPLHVPSDGRLRPMPDGQAQKGLVGESRMLGAGELEGFSTPGDDDHEPARASALEAGDRLYHDGKYRSLAEVRASDDLVVVRFTDGTNMGMEPERPVERVPADKVRSLQLVGDEGHVVPVTAAWPHPQFDGSTVLETPAGSLVINSTAYVEVAYETV